MNSIDCIQKAFTTHVQALFQSIEIAADQCRVHINVDEAKQAFGNLSTSVALGLAKELKRAPREVATEIATSFTYRLVEKIEIAGPGFINLYLTQETIKLLAQQLYEQKEEFLKPDSLDKKYN